jgi:hypothetical protein
MILPQLLPFRRLTNREAFATLKYATFSRTLDPARQRAGLYILLNKNDGIIRTFDH